MSEANDKNGNPIEVGDAVQIDGFTNLATVIATSGEILTVTFLKTGFTVGVFANLCTCISAE